MAEQQTSSGNNKPKDAKPFDAMDPWRGMRDAYLDVWAKSMVETVNSEAYAQAAGTMLDTYLTMSAPFREAVEKAMLKTLEQLAMPTRNDVVSIADRMTNIEMRLDDLDAKIDEIQKLVTGIAAGVRIAKPASRAPRKAAKSVRAKQTKRGKK